MQTVRQVIEKVTDFYVKERTLTKRKNDSLTILRKNDQYNKE